MNARAKRAALLPLINLAYQNVEALPMPERADIYEGIHLAMRGIDPALSNHARRAAEAIRAAESSQLSFRELLMRP